MDMHRKQIPVKTSAKKQQEATMDAAAGPSNAFNLTTVSTNQKLNFDSSNGPHQLEQP